MMASFDDAQLSDRIQGTDDTPCLRSRDTWGSEYWKMSPDARATNSSRSLAATAAMGSETPSPGPSRSRGGGLNCSTMTTASADGAATSSTRSRPVDWRSEMRSAAASPLALALPASFAWSLANCQT